MMKREKFSIANIYVPVKRRATLKPEIVQEIAQSMLEVGQQVPILVRPDGDRFVLRRFASARSMQGVGRGDDLRIPYPGPEALTGQDFLRKGDAAANPFGESRRSN